MSFTPGTGTSAGGTKVTFNFQGSVGAGARLVCKFGVSGRAGDGGRPLPPPTTRARSREAVSARASRGRAGGAGD